MKNLLVRIVTHLNGCIRIHKQLFIIFYKEHPATTIQSFNIIILKDFEDYYYTVLRLKLYRKL